MNKGVVEIAYLHGNMVLNRLNLHYLYLTELKPSYHGLVKYDLHIKYYILNIGQYFLTAVQFQYLELLQRQPWNQKPLGC